jgi:hypothetical protein
MPSCCRQSQRRDGRASLSLACESRWHEDLRTALEQLEEIAGDVAVAT